MLLPQSEDLAFPAWDYEDENNEDIFNTESENEPLFFLPTQDDLSPALSKLLKRIEELKKNSTNIN